MKRYYEHTLINLVEMQSIDKEFKKPNNHLKQIPTEQPVTTKQEKRAQYKLLKNKKPKSKATYQAKNHEERFNYM